MSGPAVEAIGESIRVRRCAPECEVRLAVLISPASVLLIGVCERTTAGSG